MAQTAYYQTQRIKSHRVLSADDDECYLEERKKPKMYYAVPGPNIKPNLKRYNKKGSKGITSQVEFLKDPLSQHRNIQGVAMAPG